MITYEGHKITPTVNTILVKMDKNEKITKGGIIIPDTAKVRTDFVGEIVAVSRGVLQSGEYKVGEKVICAKNTRRVAPTDDTHNEYRFYRLNEIRYAE